MASIDDTQDTIALEPLHSDSNYQDLHLDSKTASPRNRSKAFCRIKIDVGAEQFTTTKSTMSGSRLFSSFFHTLSCEDTLEPLGGTKYEKFTPRTNMVSFLENPNATSFDDFINSHATSTSSSSSSTSMKHKEELTGYSDENCKGGLPKIYEVDRNHYFVDRSPTHFGRILHYLRNRNTMSPDLFLERYYHSPSTLSSYQSMHSVSSSHYALLVELQDEAMFYELPDLAQCIAGKLAEETREVMARSAVSSTVLGPLNPPISYFSRSSHLDADKTNWTMGTNVNLSPATVPSPRSVVEDATQDLSWWDQSGPIRGLRRIKGTRIAFATACDNWCDKKASFDPPPGFVWAKQSQYLDEYYRHRHLLSTQKEWIHFGVGGWESYRWKYARKVAFLFRDSFRAQRFVHSGMEISDINHVKSLFGVTSESPLMDYDDNKGFVEGFAGLVLLSDEVWNGDDSEVKVDDGSPLIASEPKVPSLDEKVNESNGGSNAPSISDVQKFLQNTPVSQQSRPPPTTCTTEAASPLPVPPSPEVIQMTPPSNPSNKSTAKMSPELEEHDTDSEWTADEDDEQIQGLMNMLTLKEQKQVALPTATPPEPKQGAPLLANAFGALTQKRRIALTKQNLQIHTKDEALKHSMQNRLLQKPTTALSPRITAQGTQQPGHMHCTLQRSHSGHQLLNSHKQGHKLQGHKQQGNSSPPPVQRVMGRSYVGMNANMPNMRRMNGAMASPIGSPHFMPRSPVFPMVPVQQHRTPYAMNNMNAQQLPRPGLTHHLSINSLPPATNTNHMRY